MNGAEDPNKMPRFTKERTKRWHHKRMRKKKVQHRRQDAHEQLKQGKLQVGRKDHHTSHLPFIIGCHNEEGNILRQVVII